ncbi:MAG: hypothetical protein SCH98_16795 [Deferrisomatales bacterium]|nr:hypothetical protein [Deferrisomatales bacterium]
MRKTLMIALAAAFALAAAGTTLAAAPQDACGNCRSCAERVADDRHVLTPWEMGP